MILLSLVLVVASAVALGWGIATTTDQLVWGSLLAGLVAAALVAASVVRLRRRVVESPAPAAPPASGPVPTGEGTPPGVGTWPWPAQPTEPASEPSRPGWSGPVAAPWTGPPPPDPAPPTAPPAAPDAPPRDTPTAATPTPETPPPATPTAAMPAAGMPAAGTPAAGTPSGETRAGEALAGDTPAGEEAVDAGQEGEPPVERVEIRDALRVAQLPDEVRVVDGHPRYHLEPCPTLAGADPVPMPVAAARRAGFTPCGTCEPDRTLLARLRDRRRPAVD